MSTPIGWPEAQRICDIPEVRELIDAFAEDSHEENMLAMVSAIMGHAVTQGRAAGLEAERAAFEAWFTENDPDPFMKQRAVARGNTGQYLLMQTDRAWDVWQAARALSSLPSEEAQGDLLTIARDALEEIALAGMSGSGQESEEGMRDWHARRAWEFIGIAARAKTAIDAALSSLEVIGKGEKG